MIVEANWVETIVDACCVVVCCGSVLIEINVLAPCVEVIKIVEAALVVVCCGSVLVKIMVLAPCVDVIRIVEASCVVVCCGKVLIKVDAGCVVVIVDAN